jgi:UPF0755 protein
MNSAKKYFIALVLLIVIAASGLFYVRYRIYYSHGKSDNNIIFEIKKGEGNSEISANLKEKGIVSGKIYFWLYLKTRGLLNKILPGEYLLNGKMTIPEIAFIITNPEKGYKKVLFPEGLTAKQMADELTDSGFDGDGFLNLVNNPPKEIISQFSVFFDKPTYASLEGYLFPDTYYFSKEATPEGIIKKILNNTDSKITSDIKDEIKNQNKSFFDVLAMASIIEKEVASDNDRVIVSGIFWNRITIGQPLQSDATLTYILSDTKGQHTFEQTRIASPYNTYINKGLTPGPISNPGISAISAAIHPKDTNYNYFLSDPSTGKTVFSETLDEHNANKVKVGL